MINAARLRATLTVVKCGAIINPHSSKLCMLDPAGAKPPVASYKTLG